MIYLIQAIVITTFTFFLLQSGPTPLLPLQQQAPVVLTDEQDEYPLGLHLEFLEDPTRQLTIEDVTSPEFDQQFVPSQQEAPNFGLTDSTYWLRFSASNETSQTGEWWLEIANPQLDYVTLYYPQPNGVGFETRKAGNALPPTHQETSHYNTVLGLPLNPQTQQTFYLYVDSRRANLPLTLWSGQGFIRESQKDFLAMGLYLGVLLIMAGFNFFIFLSLRDKTYLYYVLFMASLLVADISSKGLLQQYLWPSQHWLNVVVPLLSAMLLFIFLLRFTASFLITKVNAPKLHQGILGLQIGLGLTTLLLLVWPGTIMLLVPWLVLLLLSVAAVFGAGIVTWRHGYYPARYFVLALTTLLGAVFLSILSVFGLISTNFTEYLTQIGVAFMALLLSLALADRINIFRREKEEAQATILHQQQETLRLNKEHTDTLEHQHNLLRTVIDNLPDYIYLKDTQYRCQLSNLANAQVWGVTPEEMIGKTLDGFYPPEEAETYNALDRLVIETGQSINQETSFLDKVTGQQRWSWMTRLPFHGPDGSLMGVVGISRDITRRKQDETALRENEARLRTIIDQIPFDLWVCDTQGRYIVQNAISLDLAGDLTGKTIDDLDLPPEIKPGYKQKHLRALSGKIEREEIEAVVKGQNRILDSVQVPVRDGEQVIGFIGMQIDITERKHAQAALQAYTHELERSNQELQDFAYAASHDLQEPLRKIQTFGNRLKSRYAGTLDDRGLDYIDRMENAADRMQILIKDLLAFSRITTKAKPFSQVDLSIIIKNILSDLETHIEEVEGQIEVGQLPTIQADPTQMRQLFQNLISNALKFHRQDVPPLITISSHTLPDSQLCQITVADNGIAFKEEYTERIFGIFQRLHGREAYPGTGVGLAVCKKIAERHGGTITAQGKPDEGSTFTVTLPITNTPL